MGTININPNFFISHLQNLRCIGIGELGLDYTTRCKCYPNHHNLSRESCTKKKIQQQHQFLHTLLPQIPASMPIVIHTNGQNAANDMIGLLLEFKKNQQPIHWHCFMGNTELVKQLTATFSNITISLSSHSIQNVETRESLWYIPSSNLILESDAPYLDSLSQKLNSPWIISSHACQITKYKNIPVSVLYEISLQNLIDLYCLPFILLPTMDPPISSREYFKGPACELSNMYSCSVVFRGKQYASLEQAYQYTRAHEIGEIQIAGELLVCQDGFRAKILSKELDKTKRARWNQSNSIPVMKELLEAKFNQVSSFKATLLNSESSFLMEATLDTFWGIGMKKEEAINCSISDLPGRNVLGWLLMALHGKHSGRGVEYLHSLLQAEPTIPFYKGIKYVLGKEPNNRD